MRKQSAPTLCITEASKANINRPRFADDTAATAAPSLHKETVIRSHTRTTSSATFSFQGPGSENATMTSLHPSMESAIDPSPRSSLDVEGNQESFSIPQPAEAVAQSSGKHNSTKVEPQPVAKPERKEGQQDEEEELPPLDYPKIQLKPLRKEPEKQPDLPPIAIKIQQPRRRRYHKAAAASPAPQPPDPPKPKSALSAMIAERASAADNPFSEFSFVSGRGDAHPITLCVYLPHSAKPYEPVSLVVRPDAIVDDVIGYILYDYVEKKRKPPLKEEMYDLAQWVLRIAEDDGEIEEDLPGKFSRLKKRRILWSYVID